MQQRELQQSPRVSIERERERERERLSSSCTRVHENTRGAARRRVVGSMRDADRVIEFHAGGSPLFPRDERGQARKLTVRITNSFVDSGADRRRNAEIYRDGDRTGIEWCTRAAREKRDVAPLVFSKPPSDRIRVSSESFPHLFHFKRSSWNFEILILLFRNEFRAQIRQIVILQASWTVTHDRN